MTPSFAFLYILYFLLPPITFPNHFLGLFISSSSFLILFLFNPQLFLLSIPILIFLFIKVILPIHFIQFVCYFQFMLFLNIIIILSIYALFVMPHLLSIIEYSIVIFLRLPFKLQFLVLLIFSLLLFLIILIYMLLNNLPYFNF